MWTRDDLKRLVAERLGEFRLICVGNREPYMHVHSPTGIRCLEPVSGVVSALDPVMRAAGGTWIAHGSGDADRETADVNGRLGVPPGADRYTLRRVWLSREEERGYYYGFANGALWPLCHIAYRPPVFERADWAAYRTVNRRFAEAVREEAGGTRALVFIQDYHFALLPRMVKDLLPNSVVFQFWHIPWPNPEVFGICPWKKEILEGLLGNDLLSFHIQYHCNNFMETVDRELESRIDREQFSVNIQGSPTLIRPQPIGIDFDLISEQAGLAATEPRMSAIRNRYGLGDARILLGVDRLDYTKGILEKIRALDRLLELHPEHVERVVLLQVGVPSRTALPAYRHFEAEVDSLVAAVNRRHRTSTWIPIVFVKENHSRTDLLPLYRMADVCMVTSVHDGMNLVAKEFVAARGDLAGVLLLSPFTGASRELTPAVLANPYATDDLAEAIQASLAMPPAEQASRMERMRESTREHNVFEWVGGLLEQALRLEVPCP
ncbi:MAG TPA: trehalose-6-phosphate synthase [Planctomycetota bacterium]|nr:trehalose-6-phosphate synthase [Planctomycetota bacterium]